VDLVARATGAEVVAIDVPGATIRGLVRPPRDPAAPWLLFFGGNGFSLADSAQAVALLIGENDIGFATFAYRGYDTSTGEPSEEALKSDARSIQHRLAGSFGVASKRLFVTGMSVGTGVAASLAGDLSRAGAPPAGLILLATYRSLPLVVSEKFPGAGKALEDEFDIEKQLPDLRMPALLVHGAADGVIPAAHSRYIAEKIGATLAELPRKGHNDLFITLHPIGNPVEKRVVIADVTVPNHVLGFIARAGFATRTYAPDYFHPGAEKLPPYIDGGIERICVGERLRGNYCTGAVMSGGSGSFERGSDGRSRAMISVPFGTLASRGHVIFADDNSLEQIDGRIALLMGTVGSFDRFSAELPARLGYHRAATTGGEGLHLYGGAGGELGLNLSFDKLFGADRQLNPSMIQVGAGPEAGLIFRSGAALGTVGLFARGSAQTINDHPDNLAVSGGAQLRFAWNDAFFVSLEAERTLATTSDESAFELARLYADYRNCSWFKACIMVGLDLQAKSRTRVFVPAEYFVGISGGLSH
jgi:hypothetical protein